MLYLALATTNMTAQTTSNIMMVRPISFRFNDQTATNNYYQKVIDNLDPHQANQLAQREFDQFVERLRAEGIHVYVFQDDAQPDTPDSIFPNNWVSFHTDGRIALYPMYARNRRLERREEMFEILADDFGFEVSEIEDFSEFEEEQIYLEGTGSMILDRPNKLAYAALSERTDRHVLQAFCEQFDYEPVVFTAYQTLDGKRVPIYHTNVMMCVGIDFAVICLESLDDTKERKNVTETLKKSGKKIIDITEDQKLHFAGNMLNVVNDRGESVLVMSTAAFNSLRPDQVQSIERHAKILHSPLDTIEALGGGSARCMMAEVFLPQKTKSATKTETPEESEEGA